MSSEATDAVILVDSGCGTIGEGPENKEELSSRNDDCKDKWEFIAELMTSIKGTENENRVLVIQFDDKEIYPITDTMGLMISMLLILIHKQKLMHIIVI